MPWLSPYFELSRGSAHNVRPMEGLRGFAVFLVFLVHYATLVVDWLIDGAAALPLAEALHTVGNAGVDLFFVLSGYLIYGSLISRRQPFMRFMARRIERLYPAFTVVFVLYVALSYLFPAESKIPPESGEALVYLLQNFLLLPGLFPIEPMITVAWSLSYELFYYLVLPLVIAGLGLRERSVRWRSALFVGAGAALLVYCALAGGPVRLALFIAGMLLFEAMTAPRVPTPSGLVGGLALALGLLSTLFPWDGTVGAALDALSLCLGFSLLCLACFRAPQAPLARLFSWSPLRWLGNMSYSYYLIHGLALKAAFLAMSVLMPGAAFGSWFFWALMPVMFALTLLPSVALFLAVERPFSLAPGAPRPRDAVAPTR
ncbi:MAG: acyltransferase [Hydrogenophaga sp. SCN 70-13]|nr:MAG: acyltransferase [Hydrogenophaga sp. SCN 70-13]